MKKQSIAKIVTLTLTTVLALGALTGCGAPKEEASGAAASSAAEEKGTITVAASPTPHAEILAKAAEILAALSE